MTDRNPNDHDHDRTDGPGPRAGAAPDTPPAARAGAPQRHRSTGLGWPDLPTGPAGTGPGPDGAARAHQGGATRADQGGAAGPGPGGDVPVGVASGPGPGPAADVPAVTASGPGHGPVPDDPDSGTGGPVPARRGSPAAVVIALLLAVLGFAFVAQVRTNVSDSALSSARQEDLVRILADLESREERLRQDIAALEESRRQLTSGAQGREAALEEATRLADELGILAGTLPAYGTGLTVRVVGGTEPVRAAALLDAVQELRGAGAEAMQISGATGGAVRIVASTSFMDTDGGVDVDGRRLVGPYRITVVGEPQTMRTALNIPGGVVESVARAGGTVIVTDEDRVEVTALHVPTPPRYARPAS